MSDAPKTNIPETPETKSEELNPLEQEEVSGGAFDAYLNFSTPPIRPK